MRSRWTVLVTMLGLLALPAQAQDGGSAPPPPPPPAGAAPPPEPPPAAPGADATTPPADDTKAVDVKSTAPEKPRGPYKPQKGAGEPAPRLTDVDWLLGKPVKQFQRGNAYLIFFWAPYDEESVRALPHLAELQKAHAADRFSVIAVAIKPEDDQVPVDGFVDRRKAALSFVVARDKLDKTAGTWDALVGLKLPRAVLVDRANRIAWTGNPFNGLDDALTAVLADDKAKIEAAVTASRDRWDQFTALTTEYTKLPPAGLYEKGLDLCEKMAALDPRLAVPYGLDHYQMLLHLGRVDDAAALGRKLVAGDLHDAEAELNNLAWFIVDPEGPIKDGDLELASLAATRATEVSLFQDPGVVDTLARVKFRQGNTADAIKLQTQAVKLGWTADERAQLQKALDEYKAAPAKK
jgi:tetratricopeptide (TPR) repeat protein